MALKIGELAGRTGLTVRALRHYDDIGLLVPSVRSASGYRLYDRHDVARLYRILALRRLGLSLADIKRLLAEGAGGISDVLTRQVQQLERDIQQATALRSHLLAMQDQLRASQEPEIDDWLVALESMVVGTKYFGPDEQLSLEALHEAFAHAATPELSARLLGMIATGTPPESPEAQELAQRWIGLLLAATDGDEGLLMKLHAMHWNEPSLHALTGVDQAGMRYISQAMAFARLQRYAPHCTAGEMATLRAHYLAQLDAWPPLIAEIREQMAANAATDSAAMRALALRWRALSLAKTGGDAALQAKLERAFDQDAAIRTGSGIDVTLASYVKQAIAELDRTPSP